MSHLLIGQMVKMSLGVLDRHLPAGLDERRLVGLDALLASVILTEGGTTGR